MKYSTCTRSRPGKSENRFFVVCDELLKRVTDRNTLTLTRLSRPRRQGVQAPSPKQESLASHLQANNTTDQHKKSDSSEHIKLLDNLPRSHYSALLRFAGRELALNCAGVRADMTVSLINNVDMKDVFSRPGSNSVNGAGE